ncbi:copper-translocating P-type ATPase [Fructilactobacillus lindneri]|nr:heavy metal translocating P-type ATPase [Fructilactobacillus lindneri]ANZ58523.1 ATPase [Fructilactobacillus lindneri]ANZ59832.1 ATPase [Fructilactobacillus lindneri]POG98319.1 copper-translocating P-type ATPase [Fructilactobacillus lindneri]POH01810.1 copper-translocating P-type ATPase [Fructilactobacillus lindneri]POH03681.1 copper-translocating P-type ATPase [Fructilactobacillus lindneri]
MKMSHSNHGDMKGMQMNHSGSMDMGGGQMMNMGNFKRRFWISLILAIPIMLLSPLMGITFAYQRDIPGSQWIVLILATILFFYGGEPFFKGAKRELKNHAPAMMTLITMGISVSYVYSVYSFIINTFVNHDAHVMNFFWELASLIVIMLLGHWIEMSAVMNAGSAVKKMAELLPNTAHLLLPDGSTKSVPLDKLQVGQEVLVQAGEKIPTDGVIVKGDSAVNEALVTGESKAVAKKPGSKVIGGSINGNGSLVEKVTATGSNGYLAQVIKLVESAQKEKSKAQTMADYVSRWLFYGALSIGILALVVWTIVSGLSYGLERMVTVLVIACPHALGLAIPLVVARSTSIAAQNGLLIRHRQAIERVKKLSYVFMDKTGTLTEGVFNVNALETTSDLSKTEVLTILADLELDSSHPLALGILNQAKKDGIQPHSATNVQIIQGVGLKGTISGKDYLIVTADYLKAHQISYDIDQFNQLASAGNSVSYLISDNQVLGVVAQGDVIRPQSFELIKNLRKMHLIPVMLTGDNDLSAKRVAHELGDIAYQAQLLPSDKEKIIKQYQAKGYDVMMVGDGVNDAPSLSRANIGVAIGAGTDVAIDSADVVLVKSDPEDIVDFINLAKATNLKMVENLWWGAGYNIIAMPLAAGILAPWGIILSPAVGAIIMSLSTVIVAVNALTLHMKKE